MELWSLSIAEAGKRLRRRQISSVELTEAVLHRIRDVENSVNAYVSVGEESALVAAAEADKKLAERQESPLLGVPIAVKDNICTHDARTTCASRILADFRPAMMRRL